MSHFSLRLVPMRRGKCAKLFPIGNFMTITPLVTLLRGDGSTRAISVMPLGQSGRANAHQLTDRGFRVPRFEGRNRFLAEVKTIRGRYRQGSKLSSTLTDLTLLRIAIASVPLANTRQSHFARLASVKSGEGNLGV